MPLSKISWPRSANPRGRPAIWINAAMSLDGRLAFPGGKRAILSSPGDFRRVDLIRATSDAVLVGAGTIRMDDPSLRVHWERLRGQRLPSEARGRKDRPPTRVVIGSSKGLPPTSRVFDGVLPTILFSPSRKDLGRTGPRTTVVPTSGLRVDLPWALRWLHVHGVQRLMVEGGSQILSSFLSAGLYDRFTLYVAPVLIGGRSAPSLFEREMLGKDLSPVPLRVQRTQGRDGGILVTIEPR